MTGFIFLSLGLVAPVLAIIVIAVLSWQDARKERRRTFALRQWLRAHG
jgi:hypothetical protein